jgi:acetoin utilization protein AcuB
MLVSEVMNKKIVTIFPDTKLSEAYALMTEKNIRHLPVLDEEKLVGIVTDRDIRLATSRLAKKTVDPGSHVKEIMSHPVQFSHPSDPIEKATQVMRELKIGCMPIVENTKVVGIVTITDLLDALLLLTGIHQPSGRLDVRLSNKAGELAKLTSIIAERKVNIHSILTYPEKDNSIRLVLRVGTIEIKSLAQAICNEGFQVIWPVHIACVN